MVMVPMTAHEALSVLSQAASNYHGTRQDHVTIQKAETVLIQFIAQAERTSDSNKPMGDLPRQDVLAPDSD